MPPSPALLLLLPLLAPVLPAADLVLAENGKARAAIVVGSDDPWQNRGKPGRAQTPAQLAAVLAAQLEGMCGAKFDVISEAALGEAAFEKGCLSAASAPVGCDRFLLVGEGNLTRKCGVITDGLGPGGIVMKTLANAVVIMGRGDGSATGGGGTGYAVYQFLEKLGCRYLWPGELGRVVPKVPTLVAPNLDVRFSPPVVQRAIRFMPYGPRNFDKGLARLGMTKEDYMAAFNVAQTAQVPVGWGEWMCLGGDIGIVGGHAGYGLRGGWAEWGQAHPEWFALQPDGTRDQSAAGERWRACVSNPGFVAQVVKSVLEESAKNPAQGCFSLAPNDGGTANYCMCEACKKLDPPNAPTIQLRVFDKVGGSQSTTIEYRSLTDRHVHFWNAVTEKVCAAKPDLLLSIDAYAEYSTPPVREKLHPNLVLRYVPSDLAGWKGWQQAGAKKVFWRPNNLHSGYQIGVLAVRARDFTDTARAFAAGGMLATDVQGIYHNWATQGLNYYALTRVIWNPSLTYEEVLEDYCKAGFGPAAEPVRKYFLRAEEIFNATAPPPTPDGAAAERPALPRPIAALTPAAIAELRGLLREAWTAAAADEPCRKRVVFLASGLEHTAATAEIYRRSVEKPARDPASMAKRWASMSDLFTQHPLAVNVALVAAFDELLLRVFGDPGQASASPAPKTTEGPAWLFEDQTPTRK